MTFRMALKHIRRYAPETEKTFRAICRNRYCHPVRDWAIYDIRKAENLFLKCARQRYDRHFRRLQEIFGEARRGYIWKGRAIAERFRSDSAPSPTRPKGTRT